MRLVVDVERLTKNTRFRYEKDGEILFEYEMSFSDLKQLSSDLIRTVKNINLELIKERELDAKADLETPASESAGNQAV